MPVNNIVDPIIFEPFFKFLHHDYPTVDDRRELACKVAALDDDSPPPDSKYMSRNFIVSHWGEDESGSAIKISAQRLESAKAPSPVLL